MLETVTVPRVGRRLEFPDRITLPLGPGVVDRIDAVLAPNEPRLDLIREAIEREIKRRQRAIKDTPASRRDSKTSRGAE